MLYAFDKNRNRIQPTETGQRAISPFSGGEVISKCGEVKVWHWAESAGNHGDSWYQPMSKWHKDWQDRFPPEWQEIVMKDQETGERHIADIQNPHTGVVIEIQHSPIKVSEIESREAFYSQNGGMVWILDGKTLLKKVDVYHRKVDGPFLPLIRLSLTIARLHTNPKTREQTNEKARNILSEAFKDVSFDDTARVWSFVFWMNPEGFCKEWEVEIAVRKALAKNGLVAEYVTIIGDSREEEVTQPSFKQKSKRQFIDRMNMPIFYDGLESFPDHLYSPQNKSIVKKDLFVSHFITSEKGFKQPIKVEKPSYYEALSEVESLEQVIRDASNKIYKAQKRDLEEREKQKFIQKEKERAAAKAKEEAKKTKEEIERRAEEKREEERREKQKQEADRLEKQRIQDIKKEIRKIAKSSYTELWENFLSDKGLTVEAVEKYKPEEKRVLTSEWVKSLPKL